MGAAFGALLMNSPLAIVCTSLLPTLWTVLGEMVRPLRGPAGWLDTNMTMEPLSAADVTGEQWGRLGGVPAGLGGPAAGRRAVPGAAPRGVLTMEMAGYRPRTVVSGGPLELAVLWGGFPLLGAGAGWLLAAATGWLARLPWVPFSDLVEWLDRLPEPQATAGTIAVGVLAGLVIAGIGTAERLIVTVDGAQVRLRRSDENRTIARVDTRVVFLADKHLVLLDADGAELVRESTDLPAAQLAAAFREHGWGWADDDPHRSAYRLWVPDLPGLPAGADALLRARERAIERDRRDDARELRRELGQIGVVLRDEGKRQYWRLTDPGPRPGPEQPTSAEREPDGR